MSYASERELRPDTVPRQDNTYHSVNGSCGAALFLPHFLLIVKLRQTLIDKQIASKI